MFMEVSTDQNLNIDEAFAFLSKALIEKQDQAGNDKSGNCSIL